jgi:hypothetical protein
MTKSFGPKSTAHEPGDVVQSEVPVSNAVGGFSMLDPEEGAGRHD